MEKASEIREQFLRYLADRHSMADFRAIQSYLQTNEAGEALAAMIEDELAMPAGQAGDDGAAIARVISRLDSSIPSEIRKAAQHASRRSNIRQLIRYVSVAASVLLVVSLGWYFYASYQGQASNLVSQYGDDVAPGGNKAILTLADGRKIMLDEAANGELAEESGIRITKTEDGQVVYEVLRHAPQARASEGRQPEAGSAGGGDRESTGVRQLADAPTYNTITTPRGGQYKIILPDSSVVWLNAASSLRYPTRFTDAERRVELTGEAFFSVRHKTSDMRHKTASAQAGGDGNKSKIVNHTSKIPFIVATATQEVTVLGTQFNINAYTDELAVKTTLVEGSVAVSLSLPTSRDRLSGGGVGGGKAQSVNSASLQLAPNQQSILSGGALTVVEANIEQAIAWKNGYFLFEDENIGSIMNKLAKWYDIEVYFEGTVPTEGFNGIISRNKPISQVLQMLEETEAVHFKITGKKVNVSK